MPEPIHNGSNGGSIPAWNRRQGNLSGPTTGGGRFAQAAQAALLAQAAEKGLDDPYELVIDTVRQELQRTGVLTTAAYDNPTGQDFETVMEVARRAIAAYNDSAPSRGLRLLIDPDAGDPAEEAGRIARRMADEVLGWGPIAPYMADPQTEEIFINGFDSIYVQRAGEPKQRVNARFRSPEQLRLFVNNKLDYGSGARTVTTRIPWRDHRLRDGSRIHVIMDPLVANLGVGGMAVTIRRFRSVARSLDDLTRLGTITRPAAQFLRAAVHAQLNICVSGGTGTGKTTFLTALTSEIDPADRVVTVEDTPELQLHHLQDWVALVTREQFEGAEAVTMADNVRHCLRMRPKRILLGEARGAEMVAILEAMNTGHDGCMFTVHADDAYKTLQRIETLYLKSNMANVPLLAIKREIAQALQVIVNIGMFRLSDGREIRRVREINVVTGRIEGDQIENEPIFVNRAGALEYTGARPSLIADRMEDRARWFRWERDLEV